MIKWGIVGLGNMAQKFANAIKETNNAKLLSISSLNSEKLKSFANNFQIDKNYVFDSYNDLISCKEIDAVYIATLNNTHLNLIKSCAENKKNILCEKPLTLNFEEANEAANYIAKHDVIFYEAIAYYSHGQTKNLIALLNENKIGKIISINSTFGFKVKRVNPKSRIFDKSLGGGAILDVGCYPLSLLNLISKNSKNIKFANAKGSFSSISASSKSVCFTTVACAFGCWPKGFSGNFTALAVAFGVRSCSAFCSSSRVWIIFLVSVFTISFCCSTLKPVAITVIEMEPSRLSSSPTPIMMFAL